MEPQQPALTEKRFIITFTFVTSLFLMWGLLHSMSDVLNKHFQNVLHLSKSQSGLIQFSVFGAYFVMSIPAGFFLKKFGYKPGVILGLCLFAIGLFLFVPAANAVSFTFFRIALFVMGCGMATLETVAHPFAAALGDQQRSDQRVNFAQAFNAIGTMIGPALGTYFLLGANPISLPDLGSVKILYVAIGVVILLIALAFLFLKIPQLEDAHSDNANLKLVTEHIDVRADKKLFQHTHFKWAVAAQFFNVAAQAGTWAYFINYGVEVMHFSNEKAGYFMIVFMGMMALGRIVGTWLMSYVAPNKLLALFSCGSILMCLTVAQGAGWISYTALLMINFFFSIMFPTIFSLGIKNLGKRTQQGSSFIAMGVVGGAIFPTIMGEIANKSVAHAYYLPIVCYTVIFLYGAKFYRVKAI
nr:sugar MFS transporter [uncultured Mucilaginibacter sp.]